MSRRVLVVVEGHTEHSVLKSLVAPHLGASGVYLEAKVVGRPGHKGGVYRRFESVAKEIVNLFKQEPTSVVSTFFDFYGMPEDWPGLAAARQARASGQSAIQVAERVEEAWRQEVARKTSDFGQQVHFVPYVQMHELEALLFAGPRHMAEGFLRLDLETKFQQIVAECGGCEDINDQPQSAPSKRIETLYPGYRKGRDKNKAEDRRPHAPVIAARIGISSIRAACPHSTSGLHAWSCWGNAQVRHNSGIGVSRLFVKIHRCRGRISCGRTRPEPGLRQRQETRPFASCPDEGERRAAPSRGPRRGERSH